MKNLRYLISLVSMFSVLLMMTASISAAPVKFNQVSQIIDVNPSNTKLANYTQLRLSDDTLATVSNDDSDDTKVIKPQDDRVITETKIEIVEMQDCNCIQDGTGGGFPYWTLLGLAAIPAAILIARDGDDDPTPTPSGSPTESPTGSPGETPTETPTASPTESPTMSPPPSPTTEPVPEPMTILLFGTGLAGVGFAARRKLGFSEEKEEEDEE